MNCNVSCKLLGELEIFRSPNRKSEKVLERKKHKKYVERKQTFCLSFKSKVMLHLCCTGRICGHTGAIKSESGFISCFELPLPRLGVPTRLAHYYLLEGRCACGIRRYDDRRSLPPRPYAKPIICAVFWVDC